MYLIYIYLLLKRQAPRGGGKGKQGGGGHTNTATVLPAATEKIRMAWSPCDVAKRVPSALEAIAIVQRTSGGRLHALSVT
jgi:hypothetical protein